MDKYDQLAIRACKSSLHGSKLLNRLVRIMARRNNVGVDYVSLSWLVDWIMNIREKFITKIRWDAILYNAAPEQGWKYGVADTSENNRYWIRLILVLASDIARTEVKDIPGYVAPAWFRNRRRLDK